MQNTNKSCLMIVAGLFSLVTISSRFPYASALLIGGKVVKEYVPRQKFWWLMNPKALPRQERNSTS